jgi:hypothetical protein
MEDGFAIFPLHPLLQLLIPSPNPIASLAPDPMQLPSLPLACSGSKCLPISHTSAQPIAVHLRQNSSAIGSTRQATAVLQEHAQEMLLPGRQF